MVQVSRRDVAAGAVGVGLVGVFFGVRNWLRSRAAKKAAVAKLVAEAEHKAAA